MLTVTWEDFTADANRLVTQLVPYASNFKAVYGIPRGGLVLATYLSHAFDKPLFLPGISPGREVLVVDDNVVTGHSLEPFAQRGCLIAALLVNPNAKLLEYTERFFYARTTPEWPIFPWEPA